MIIKGLQKTTLLDFPRKVACTVFTGGCNFRCPFCHNASLVLTSGEVPDISEEQFFSFLAKRKGILDGVCITGGEPLLCHDIINFIKKIKELGFAVKLDTNGSFPDKLEMIISENIVDYIAMDIKNSKEKYALTTGLRSAPEAIFKSIEIIMSGNIPYEFRTTVVKELHTVEDIEDIAHMIYGAKQYYLQCFNDSGDLIENGFSAHPEETMKKMHDVACSYVIKCELRGI